MNTFFAAAMALLMAPTAVMAQPGDRFTDGQYLRAARCAAYSQTAALKDESAATVWLAKTLKEQRTNREEFILTKAGDEARAIERAARKANTGAKIAALRDAKAKACVGLADTGVTSAEAPATPGG